MIDSHCHLDFEAFKNEREELVAAAHRAGVHTIINIGVDLESSSRSVALAERFDNIYATVGVHPHDADTLDEAGLRELEEMAGHSRVVAIGEIGLDYYRNLSPRRVQIEAYRRQLELAGRLNLPVVIHTRAAFDQSIAILAEYTSRLPGGVFHCFPGDIEDAQKVLGLGFAIGVGGVITFGDTQMARVAAALPLESILLETDAPFVAPVPFRGKRNQPAYVAHVCRRLAELRDCPVTEVEKITDRNCRKLFGLVDTFGG
jgi:TatD DNase family protein